MTDEMPSIDQKLLSIRALKHHGKNNNIFRGFLVYILVQKQLPQTYLCFCQAYVKFNSHLGEITRKVPSKIIKFSNTHKTSKFYKKER